MNIQKQFTVGSVTVNAVMPNAIFQDELLGILTPKIYIAFQVAAKQGGTLGVEEVAFMLMSIPASDKKRIIDILLDSAFLADSQVKVSAKDFQGQMVNFNRLLAELLLWNLSDFFEYLSTDLKAHKEAVENALQKTE